MRYCASANRKGIVEHRRLSRLCRTCVNEHLQLNVGCLLTNAQGIIALVYQEWSRRGASGFEMRNYCCLERIYRAGEKSAARSALQPAIRHVLTY